MSSIATRCLPFSALTVQEWHDIVRLRVDVFVVEQNCVYPEIDGRDPDAQHMLGYARGRLIAYARIILPKHAAGVFHIGRVVLRKSHRNGGRGTDIMRACLRWIWNLDVYATVCVQAQAHLQAWYEDLGFHCISEEPYDWDGILHVDMEVRGKG